MHINEYVYIYIYIYKYTCVYVNVWAFFLSVGNLIARTLKNIGQSCAEVEPHVWWKEITSCLRKVAH